MPAARDGWPVATMASPGLNVWSVQPRLASTVAGANCTAQTTFWPLSFVRFDLEHGVRIAEDPADDGAANLDRALLIEERRLRVVRDALGAAIATASTRQQSSRQIAAASSVTSTREPHGDGGVLGNAGKAMKFGS